LEGSFKYCSKVHCPHIAARNLPRRSSAREQFPELEAVLATGECSTNTPTATTLPKPYMLVLSYDRTCNLACPQCRSSFYSATTAEQEQMDHDYEELILTVAKDVTVLSLEHRALQEEKRVIPRSATCLRALREHVAQRSRQQISLHCNLRQTQSPLAKKCGSRGRLHDRGDYGADNLSG